jgi:hypothetical protein
MQFRAVVPSGVHPGQIVRVNANGVQLDVKVPKGSQPGDAFVFDIDEKELKQQKTAETTIIGAAATTSTNSRLYNSPYRQFGSAVCMAALLALSIMFGFLLGILYVTEPLGPNGAIPLTISKNK